jgi:(p)ppGpp synthase/HD superfamily hydrolase
VPKLSPKFTEAFHYALEKHGGQTRKGTPRPYMGHLIGVSSIVLQYGGDEEQAIAALLHDAAEDAGGRPVLEEIRSRFGGRVARIVEGCTDTFEQPKPSWRPRKEKYIAHVAHAEPATLLVSTADKLYNVREIIIDYRAHGEKTWERFAGKRDGTLWYYRALVDAYRPVLAHPIVDDFDREVGELERLAAGGR